MDDLATGYFVLLVFVRFASRNLLDLKYRWRRMARACNGIHFVSLFYLFTMVIYDGLLRLSGEILERSIWCIVRDFRSLGNLEWLIWKNGKIIHRSWLRIETKRKERNIGKFFIVSNILQSLSFMIKK